MLHIIKKQIIELKLPDRNNAFLIQHEFHNFYWNKIVPELERIFNQLSNEGEIIRIDKLELELGVFQLSQLTSTDSFIGIGTKLFADIKEKARTCLEQKHKNNSGAGIIMQWLHYMEKGYLDWNTMSTGTAWYRQVLEGLATDYNSISLLGKLISSNRNALQRIVTIHDDIFLIHLAEVFSARKQNVLHEFIRDLEKILSSISAGKLFLDVADKMIIKQKVWEKIIESAARQREGLTSEMLVHQIIGWMVKRETQNEWIKLTTKVKAFTFNHYLVEKMTGSKHVERKETKKRKDKPQINSGIDLDNGAENIRAQQNGRPGKIEDIVNRQKVQSNTDAIFHELKILRHDEPKEVQDIFLEPVIDEIFACHAGIVLLHPFLTTLFTRLALIHEGKFVDASSQIRAVHILYYLVTGKEGPEEFELLILKFIAGYPLQKPITPVLLLQEEKEEADNLLEVVIGKWKIIGNTSPSSLRESFLQRNGKLYSRDDKLYLHLESSSIDMLLDHLPWNLSMLKLPWMKELLRVEWR